MTVWTIGHSTRPLMELIATLKAHRIEALADVRSFPASARHPQFNEKVLAAELQHADISYHWFGKGLGGWRKKIRADSPHTALRSAGFRNYADHVATEEFLRGIEAVLKRAETKRTATMCAERLWWRCHRWLLSDYLSGICGVEVVHIHDAKKTEPHRLHRTARIAGDQLVYDVGESGKLL